MIADMADRPFGVCVNAPTRRNAAQYFCYDGFGHDAPPGGALWQVPARRSNRRVGAESRSVTSSANDGFSGSPSCILGGNARAPYGPSKGNSARPSGTAWNQPAI
jgi:hypothetical protein